MAFVQDGINAYVNRLVRKELYSKFVSSRPLLWFIAAQQQMGLDKLLYAQKNPNDNFKAGVTLGGSDMGIAKRAQLNGSIGNEFRYQKTRPTLPSNVAPGGATPVASSFSEDLLGTAETRWTLTLTPIKVRESSIENSKGDVALGSVIEDAVAMSFNEAFRGRQDNFWNGTLTAAQQNKVEWSDGLLGVRHWVNDGVANANFATVGRVDRTVETVLKSTVNTAAAMITSGYLPSTVPTLSMIRSLRVIDSLGGIANLDPDGGDLVITTPDLWIALANEAEGQHEIFDDGKNIPGISMSIGMKYPVIKKDQTYITYDPSCTAGELLMFTTSSWMYEIQGGLNYKVGNWVPKHETEEGGERYRWTNISLKDRFTCCKPWLQTIVTGLTAS